jgi:hypothetical protein
MTDYIIPEHAKQIAAKEVGLRITAADQEYKNDKTLPV